jgi:hypothetical protein
VTPRVFRIAGWYKILSAVAMLLFCAVGAYYIAYGSTMLWRGGGVAFALFGIAGFIDVLMSRIELHEESIRVISLVRHRAYPRRDFESAKVDGGVVCLKRKDGGWLILPGTGGNALSVRNTVDAWIKKGAK